MLISVYDLAQTPDFKLYVDQLRVAMCNKELTKSITPLATVDTLCQAYAAPGYPSYSVETFFSIKDGVLHGILQYQAMSYENGFIHCTESLAFHITKNDLTFGRDYRQYYEFLNNNVHKVNISIMGNFNEDDFAVKYGKPFEALLRHLKPYGGRYVGCFEKHTTNAQGNIVDVHLIEYITKLGKETFYNKSV